MKNPETPNQVPYKTLDSYISAVTVYTDRALVTRCATITLDGEEQELAIVGLPLTVQAESIRAKGSGSVAVQLLGVRVEHVFANEPVAEQVAQLTQQIKQLEEQFRQIQDQLESLRLQRSFVQGLGEKSVDQFSQSLARQRVGLDETKNLLDFLGQQYSDFATAIAQREQQRQEIDHQLQVLRQRLKYIQTPRPQESYTLIVAIAPAGPGEFELEVSYLVSRASWIPLYDLRINTTENPARNTLGAATETLSEQVNLNYLAEIKQSSGEDWNNVALTLSTAKPGLGTLPPQLAPWYVDVPNPPGSAPRMRRAAAMGDMERGYAALSAAPGSELVSTLARLEAEVITATISQEGGVVTFQLDRNGNIASDGTPHKVTLFNDDYPCRMEYIAMPRLVSFAYLQATVTNDRQGATLLPGTANIFRDSVFVGTTQLENIAPGQEFQLNLGIDEGLKIERDLVEREVDKRFIGGQRRITYAYRLGVTNLSNCTNTLKLTEQLPISRNEQIKVRLTRTNPSIQLAEMGLLEWRLVLLPQTKQELYYQFTVEHPTDISTVGLDI